MATKLEIANGALRLCGVEAISDNDEDTTTAQVVRDLYDITYAYCLSLHKWSFAKVLTTQLSKLAGGDTPDGFERYQRPAGALVVTKLFTSYDGEIPFRTDGDELVTLIDIDTTSGVFCAYETTIDEGQLTGSVVGALVYALASDICEPLTENSSKADGLRVEAFGASDSKAVGGKMGHAMMVDTRQGGQQRLFRSEECSMLTHRGFYGRSTGWRKGY